MKRLQSSITTIYCKSWSPVSGDEVSLWDQVQNGTKRQCVAVRPTSAPSMQASEMNKKADPLRPIEKMHL